MTENEIFIRGIAAAAYHEKNQPLHKKIAEAKHNAEKLYPAKKFRSAGPVPTRMLHCALFRVADKRVAREDRIVERFALSSGGFLEYKGAELRQAEAAVFAYLGGLAAGRGLGIWFTIEPKKAARELGWADSPKSVDKLAACLDRLADTNLRFFDKSGEHRWTSSLLLEWRRNDNGTWEGKLPGSLTPEHWQLFSATTHLNINLLAKVPEGLTSWLYGFIAANDCRLPFRFEDLRIYSGSRCAELKEFGAQVRAALEVLKAAGAIKDYTAVRGSVSVKK